MHHILRRYAQHSGPTPRVVATVEIWDDIAPGITKKIDEIELTLDGEYGAMSAIDAAAEAVLRQNGLLT
jgi:hypothetical protein